MPRSAINARVATADRQLVANRASTNTLLFTDDFSSGSLANYTVGAGTWAATGGVLTATAGTGSNWAQRLIATNTSNYTDFDATMLIRKPSFNTMFAFRTGTTAGSGYGIQLRDTNNFRLERWGSATLVTVTPITWVTGTWYNVRVRCQGSNIKAKVWAVGGGEPGSWNIDTNNTVFTTGRLAFANESATGTSEFDDLTVNALGARVAIT